MPSPEGKTEVSGVGLPSKPEIRPGQIQMPPSALTETEPGKMAGEQSPSQGREGEMNRDFPPAPPPQAADPRNPAGDKDSWLPLVDDVPFHRALRSGSPLGTQEIPVRDPVFGRLMNQVAPGSLTASLLERCREILTDLLAGKKDAISAEMEWIMGPSLEAMVQGKEETGLRFLQWRLDAPRSFSLRFALRSLELEGEILLLAGQDDQPWTLGDLWVQPVPDPQDEDSTRQFPDETVRLLQDKEN